MTLRVSDGGLALRPEVRGEPVDATPPVSVLSRHQEAPALAQALLRNVTFSRCFRIPEVRFATTIRMEK